MTVCFLHFCYKTQSLPAILNSVARLTPHFKWGKQCVIFCLLPGTSDLLLHISPLRSLAGGCVKFDARINFPCSYVSTLRDFSTSCLRLESSSGSSTECARVSPLKVRSSRTLEMEEKEEAEEELLHGLLPGCKEWFHSTCWGGKVEPTDLLKQECFGLLTGWTTPQLKCRFWLRLLKHFSIVNVLS